MSFFSPEGGLYRFITRFWDIVKLSVLWIVFSLPIVTIGPATIAVFSVTMKMIDEAEGYVAHQFVKAFKANLRNGIPLGLLSDVPERRGHDAACFRTDRTLCFYDGVCLCISPFCTL